MIIKSFELRIKIIRLIKIIKSSLVPFSKVKILLEVLNLIQNVLFLVFD